MPTTSVTTSSAITSGETKGMNEKSENAKPKSSLNINVIVKKIPEKRPKYLKLGLVRTSYEVFKGEGELVLYCEHLHSVKYKDPDKWRDKVEVKK